MEISRLKEMTPELLLSWETIDGQFFDKAHFWKHIGNQYLLMRFYFVHTQLFSNRLLHQDQCSLGAPASNFQGNSFQEVDCSNKVNHLAPNSIDTAQDFFLPIEDNLILLVQPSLWPEKARNPASKSVAINGHMRG